MFAVYDGHGEHGQEVSQFCMEFIRDQLSAHPDFERDLGKALTETFLACDAAMTDNEAVHCKHSGTTAVVAVLEGSKLTFASCGDSRAVLAKTCSESADGSKSMDLTKDHNPDVPEEKARIEAAGGFVKPATADGFSARVYLNPEFTQVGLAMARSLGDHCVKGVGVVAEPTIAVYDLEDDDLFFILASDGIWEFISSEFAVELAAANVLSDEGDATAACQELILEAAAKWNEEEGDYRDDITCMVIKCNPLDSTDDKVA